MKNISYNDQYIKYIVLGFISCLLVVPVLPLLGMISTENTPYLTILLEYGIILQYFMNTLNLLVKVGILSIILGFLSAYFITFYNIPFKRVIKTLLALPLAIPVYIGAYTYTFIYIDIPVLEVLFKNSFFLNGSAFIYALFLYPYVYLMSRAYLKRNLGEYIDASSVLGVSRVKTFFRIIVPMSRPVILGSVLFVLFETLSDFAVVEYLGVETVSKIITDSWLGLGQKETAAKVSLLLLGVLFIGLFIEKWFVRRKRYHASSHKPIAILKASPYAQFGIYLFLGTIITLGVLLPLSTLLRYSFIHFDKIDLTIIFMSTKNTVVTTTIVIAIIIVLAAVMSSIVHSLKKGYRVFYNIGVLGYSIPSLVLALGVYIVAIQFDKWLFNLPGYNLDTFLLTGTRLALIIGLTIKFFSMAFSNYSNTLLKTHQNIFDASAVLGANFFTTFKRVHVPLLSKATIPIIILLAIDLLKELTLTYSLRPFNYRSLSTEIYRYAGNEMLEVSAFPSMIIIGLCIIFILLFERGDSHAKHE